MSQSSFPSGRATAQVNGAALCRNYRLLLDRARRHRPSARLIAVVKDNAYGHGIPVAVPLLRDAGCDFFAVATADEALSVKALCPTAEVLVLGYTPPHTAPVLAAARITQTVFSPAYGAALDEALAASGLSLSVHIKIDGGMHRGGLSPRDGEGLGFCLSRPRLLPTGIYTHFPSADTQRGATLRALKEFCAVVRELRGAGYRLFAHAAASAAALTLPCAVLDGIRTGLALYGLSPVETDLPLSPVLSLHAPIVCLTQVPRGTAVGYGGAFVTNRESLLGTLPIGYGDGLFRGLSALPVTLTHQKRDFTLPIAGRICMDHTVLDLTNTPAAIGDCVRLWQDARLPAALLHTIPYEILTAIAPRVARRLV